MIHEPITCRRALSPSEQIVLDAVIAPFTTKQVVHSASSIAGRTLPKATVSGALSNLRRFGYLTSSRRAKADGKASVVVWRRVAQ